LSIEFLDVIIVKKLALAARRPSFVPILYDLQNNETTISEPDHLESKPSMSIHGNSECAKKTVEILDLFRWENC